MEVHKLQMAVSQAKECAVNTIDHLYCENERHVLCDSDMDRLRDAAQTLMYCRDLEKYLQSVTIK